MRCFLLHFAFISVYLYNGCSDVSAACTTYTVKSGETYYAISQSRGISHQLQVWGHLYAISHANGISLSNFQSWNSGINCNNLQIGQKVCISQPSGSSSSSNYNGKIFRQYIGALYNGVKFTDVPINTGVSFHFILSLAIDYTSSASPTNGLFHISWQNSVLTPAAVQSVKSQYSNVKVMVTFGRDNISGHPVQFRASCVNSWVYNAHVDGIDIEYEHFDSVSTDTFVSCIGQLIQQLKSSGLISVASIAPFDGVQKEYKVLSDQYNNVIDLVHFHFYWYASSTSASQFGGGAKVLASFSTGGVGPAPSTALSAIQQLKSNGPLPGIFIFSADGSYAASIFQYER
ncbi:hypothetical protein KP509_1Z245700 [Ceratopteris richardii]|nr:hypothetical protein KP509_1Z245700 [Ceratopteris richardii]